MPGHHMGGIQNVYEQGPKGEGGKTSRKLKLSLGWYLRFGFEKLV
jgi:hypothetical protein